VSWAVLFDLLLCVLVAGVALCTVWVRDLFAAVVLFIVYGLFVAVAWTRLGAVDVALAEAAIGAGLTGVLLVRAVSRLRPAPGPRRMRVTRAAAAGQVMPALLCLALFLALAAVALNPPAPTGLGPQVEAHLGRTGVSNPVTAVLLNFRGYDTLLETVVLLAALVAVWSLGDDRTWAGQPGPGDHARPDGVLASFARLLPPVGLLVGLHLFWSGADAPGGAFQAGTVLAAVWLLATMAGLMPPPAVSSWRLRILVAAGPVLFLVAAAAALPFGGLLVFPPAHAKAMVLVVEAGLTVSIAATLGLLVMGPPASPEPQE
jgi:multisubunit Na+/H+ antiporter MnhB subunit